MKITYKDYLEEMRRYKASGTINKFIGFETWKRIVLAIEERKTVIK